MVQPQRRLSPRTSRCFSLLWGSTWVAYLGALGIKVQLQRRLISLRSRDVFLRYFVHPDGLFGAPGTKYNCRRHFFPKESRDFLATLTPQVAYSVAPVTNTIPNDDFLSEVEMFRYFVPPRWPIRCTRYKYNNLVDDFPQGSRDVFRYFVHLVALFGALV
ncbi:unnamed protein product [Trichogramma brassicae]|uniref:Uncharacterized protein n=1 Tax=Trichogramma brassicae TaxID=86971 RepID=A0A6H5J2A3_9HYME|nr:unnamed protein product [Trichogramma brassicae]